MALARDERADLLALLETLSPEQWNAPTLCSEWTVRDVVAHVVSYDELSTGQLVKLVAKGRFKFGGINAVVLEAFGRREPDELLTYLKEHLEPRGVPAARKGGIGLTDAVIHHQDVRRPLGMPREIPAERLVAALPIGRTAPPTRAFARTRGLRFVATDIDWSSGKGPEVRGAAEPLLLAMSGRRGIVGELSGPGQLTLAARIGD